MENLRLILPGNKKPATKKNPENKPCQVQGCLYPAFTTGLCFKHYRYHKRQQQMAEEVRDE